MPSATTTRAQSEERPGALRGVATETSRASNIPYPDVRAILQALRPDILPPSIRNAPQGPPLESAWNVWVADHTRDVLARLAAGDDESVVNLMLFGTRFTTLPRATERDIADMADGHAAPALIRERILAMLSALTRPAADERLQFAAHVLARNAIDPRTPQGRVDALRWLDEGVARVVAEYRRYAALVHDPGTTSAARSTMYRDRGLASDTTIFPGYGLEQTLAALAEKGLIEPGSVRRVAIIGPGLDFADKHEGLDFYPLQTMQPFAVIDSLLRLELARLEDLQVTTLELSPRVNRHLEDARARGDYVLQLPRTDAPFRWTPFLVDYWGAFGSAIGEEVPAIATHHAGIHNRAVRVRRDVVETIVPRELNIVLQRLDPMPPGARFDLVIGTNVLIYYDLFEQVLSVANVGTMLRPGGMLLTNTPVPLLPSLPMELLGYTEVGYTDRPEGDRFFWYRRQ